jgi:hypothetical protein
LNAELPQNSRYHIVQEFNRGIYDYIIATDEGELMEDPDDDDESSIGAGYTLFTSFFPCFSLLSLLSLFFSK